MIQVAIHNGLSPATAKWFAVLTRVKAEKKVGQLLTERGIQAYVPFQRVTRIYSRKKRTVLLPLIYRYIFVHIKETEYVPVLETPHVDGFVKFNKQLIPIPDHEIDWLRRITGETFEIQLENKPFVQGEAVRVIYGNLTGIRGTYIHSLSKHEMLVELDHVGIGLRIQIDPAHIQRVS